MTGKNIENMTNLELDNALAEAIGEFVDRGGDRVLLRATDEGAEERWPELDDELFEQWFAWSPSTNIGDFADIKGEMERRGMSWQVSYDHVNGIYWSMVKGKYYGWCMDKLECRAGCIAFLRALGEGRDNEED